jgi:hypothetical protein
MRYGIMNKRIVMNVKKIVMSLVVSMHMPFLSATFKLNLISIENRTSEAYYISPANYNDVVNEEINYILSPNSEINFGEKNAWDIINSEDELAHRPVKDVFLHAEKKLEKGYVLNSFCLYDSNKNYVGRLTAYINKKKFFGEDANINEPKHLFINFETEEKAASIATHLLGNEFFNAELQRLKHLEISITLQKDADNRLEAIGGFFLPHHQ